MRRAGQTGAQNARKVEEDRTMERPAATNYQFVELIFKYPAR